MNQRENKKKPLKFNPISVDKPGTYRWFESQHSVVNDIVNKSLLSCNCTLSKTALRRLHNEIESCLGLPETKEET